MAPSIGPRNSVAAPTSPSTTSEVILTQGKPVLSQSQQGDSNVRNGLGRPSALGSQQSLITSLESEVQGILEEGDSDKDNEGGISSETNKKRKVDGVAQERKTSGKYSHGTKARIHLGVMVAGSIVGIALSVVCPPLGIAGVAFLNTGLLKLHGGKVFWLDTKSEKNKDEQPKKQPDENPENKPPQDTQTQPPKPADIPDDSHPKKDPEDNADDFPHVIKAKGKNHTINSFVNIKIDIPHTDPEQNDSSTNTDKDPEQEISTPEEILTEHGRVTPQELLTVQEILKEYKEKVVHLVEEPQSDDDVFFDAPEPEDGVEVKTARKLTSNDSTSGPEHGHQVVVPQTSGNGSWPTVEPARGVIGSGAHTGANYTGNNDHEKVRIANSPSGETQTSKVVKPQTPEQFFDAPKPEDGVEVKTARKLTSNDSTSGPEHGHQVVVPQTSGNGSWPTVEPARGVIGSGAHTGANYTGNNDHEKVRIANSPSGEAQTSKVVKPQTPEQFFDAPEPEDGVEVKTARKITSNDSTSGPEHGHQVVVPQTSGNGSWPTVEPARGVIGSGAHTGANYTGNNDHEKVRIANSPSGETQTSKVVKPQTPEQFFDAPKPEDGVEVKTARKLTSNDSTSGPEHGHQVVVPQTSGNGSWPTVEPARGVIGSGAHTGANYTGNNDHEKVRIANSPSGETQTSKVVKPQTPEQFFDAPKPEDGVEVKTARKLTSNDSTSGPEHGHQVVVPQTSGNGSWPTVEPARGVIGSGAHTGANYTGNNDHEKVRIANSPSGETQTSKVVKPQTPEQFFDAPKPEDGVEVKTARKLTSNDSTSGPEHGHQVVVPQTSGNGSWPTVEPARGVIGSGANTGASYTGNNVHDKVRVSNYKLPIETQRVLGQKSANKKLYMEKTGNVATAIQSRGMDRQVKLPYFNTSNQLASGSYKAYFQTLSKQNSYDELKEADNQQSEAPKLRIFGGNGFPRVDKNNFVQVSSHA
ncbi:hypothetical protein ACN3E9_00490 [Vibrio pectenicida]|uniref:hypothetical protein n=1 Tax=Vibrio pectenicida TaxID=62763 RepID=UPI003B9D2A44